jgi:hypothetical protein
MTTPATGRRPRLAVVHPYWTLWEHTAGPTFRADRMALARAVADDLAASGAVEPVAVLEIGSGEDGLAVGRRLADTGVDVVLIVQTMAAPAAWTMAALDALPAIPVVVWALHETGLVDGSFDHGSITTQGATVGAPMISNLLSRADRPFELVLGRRSDPATVARVEAALRLAGIARGIATSRLGRIGRPLDGYAHVDVDDDALRAATGIELIAVDPDEVVDRYRAVADADVAALEADVRLDWTFEGDPSADSIDRSLRAALALEAVVDAHGLDGGAFNCHVPQFRFGEPIGIAPCWALGRLTSGGRDAHHQATGRRGRLPRDRGHRLRQRRGRHRQLRGARPGLAPGGRPAASPAQRLVLWQGPALRRLRRPGASTGSGDAGRIHAASPRAWRVPLRRGSRRADRADLPRDRHRQRGVPLPRRAGGGGVGPLGARRRQPPQFRDTGRPVG